MKLKMKKTIAFLALMFCFCLVVGAGYTLARYAGVFDAGSFFLSLTSSGGGGGVEPGEAYKLYYHTFDETGADIVYKTETIYENLPVTIEAAPEAHSNLHFLGWSPQGIWMTDEDFAHELESEVEPLHPLTRYFYRFAQS